MLKPILAAACLCCAGLGAAEAQSQAQQSGLSGRQITELVAGATVEVDTPVGTKLPLSYGRDGRVAGEAGELAWYLGAASDKGRWWVAADQLCHRWKTWFNAEPQCIRLTRQGRALHWRSADGSTGTARVTVPASIAAAAVPPWKPGRMLRFAQPPAAEAAPKHAHAPAVQAPAPITAPPQQQAAAEPAAPTAASVPHAAAEPVPPVGAQAPAAPPVTLPSLIVPPAAAAPAAAPVPQVPAAGAATSAWPPQQAELPHPGPVATQARFKVANVRRDDVLNVRSGPSADHDIVGELAPGSRGIAVTSECRSRWCPVQHNAMTGWVNSAYLAPEIVHASLHANLHAPADTPAGVSRDSPEAPRACLTPAARALLDRIERNFGPVEVVSTCRPGALIAGTRRPSRHASGNAVDFKAGARKAAILEWLIANHRAGGIMTYAGMDHIHVDIGPRFVSLAGGRHWSSWRSQRSD